MYIYMYIYIYVYTYVYIYIYIHVHTYRAVARDAATHQIKEDPAAFPDGMKATDGIGTPGPNPAICVNWCF